MTRRRSKVGGRRKGAGRPRSPDPRRNKATVKLTDGQLARVRAAAKAAERSVSDWVAAACERALEVRRLPTDPPT